MGGEEEYGFDEMYSKFSADILAQVRRETYEDDLGQYSWTVKAELIAIFRALGLGQGRRLLDVCCGAGGPARFAALATGCEVVGVDNSEGAIATATHLTEKEGLKDRVTFQLADGGKRLSLPDASFDAIFCIDAIVLLPDRLAVLRDWARLLRAGYRLAYTDPGILTGFTTLGELTLRTGGAESFIFSIPGQNERLMKEADLFLVSAEDSTSTMEKVAARAHASRSRHQAELEKLEGKEAFVEQQRFYEGTRRLAADRRQSRFTFMAERR